nr:alanine:cation symporter family protein [Xenorhabdus cabanillasii]
MRLLPECAILSVNIFTARFSPNSTAVTDCTICAWAFFYAIAIGDCNSSLLGEKCIQYLLGAKAIIPFRIIWIIALPIGATQSLNFVWLLADTLNAMMAIPNLIAIALLSPVVYRLTKDHIHDVNAVSIEMKASSVEIKTAMKTD